MEIHHNNGSHKRILSDSPWPKLHEVLRHSHSIQRHTSIPAFSHGDAWLRNRFRGVTLARSWKPDNEPCRNQNAWRSLLWWSNFGRAISQLVISVRVTAKMYTEIISKQDSSVRWYYDDPRLGLVARTSVSIQTYHLILVLVYPSQNSETTSVFHWCCESLVTRTAQLCTVYRPFGYYCRQQGVFWPTYMA